MASQPEATAACKLAKRKTSRKVRTTRHLTKSVKQRESQHFYSFTDNRLLQTARMATFGGTAEINEKSIQRILDVIDLGSTPQISDALPSAKPHALSFKLHLCSNNRQFLRTLQPLFRAKNQIRLRTTLSEVDECISLLTQTTARILVQLSNLLIPHLSSLPPRKSLSPTRM